MERLPLPREEVIKAIEFKGPSRVPMMIHMWNSPQQYSSEEDKERILQLHREYPMDTFNAWPQMPDGWNAPEDDRSYRWAHRDRSASDDRAAIDARQIISSWDELDDFLADFPDPNRPGIFDNAINAVAQNANGRYVLSGFWFCYYERLWSLRGMQNILMDFYDHPDEVKRLMRAITDFYLVIIRRAHDELGADGIWTSDDLGMQTGPMFSPDIFREFFNPLYKELFDECHRHAMHFWLHCCGCITEILGDFIEIGLDVIHPIQKYTMDERKVVEEFGGRICVLSGFDVQQILPWGTPEDVRQEVRFLIDNFDLPSGGMMITAGNGITGNNPIHNLEAFYDESYRYGIEHRKLVG